MRAHGLEPLLQWARAVVPAEQHHTTPVFLLGTAGLRGLQAHEKERLMQEARQILQSSGFRWAGRQQVKCRSKLPVAIAVPAESNMSIMVNAHTSQV
jgi:Golgi nucleoside diphosphatase